MRGLAGRVAFVTGAGGGIGRAIVKRLAEEGAIVVAADVSHAALGSTSEEMSARRGEATFLEVDVVDGAAVRSAIGRIVEDRGRLDLLVNAHGVYHQGTADQGPVEADTADHWERMLSVNLMGVVNTTRAALEPMKRQRYGRIVTISSAAGVVGGYACSAAYASSKAAVACFMKCTAREGAAYGVTANSIAPGQIDTAMTQVVTTRVPLASIEERTPLGRLGDPSEIASTVAFLGSDDASFITGQVVGVNGGMVMV